METTNIFVAARIFVQQYDLMAQYISYHENCWPLSEGVRLACSLMHHDAVHYFINEGPDDAGETMVRYAVKYIVNGIYDLDCPKMLNAFDTDNVSLESFKAAIEALDALPDVTKEELKSFFVMLHNQ